MRRWRGLKSLIVDAVDHGSRAVERIQLETARVPFEILEKVPPLAEPVKGIHTVYNTSVTATHGIIRWVNGVVGKGLDVVIDVAEAEQARRARASGDADAEADAERGAGER